MLDLISCYRLNIGFLEPIFYMRAALHKPYGGYWISSAMLSN